MTKTEIVTRIVAGMELETIRALVQDCIQHNKNESAKNNPKLLNANEYIVMDASELADEIIKQTKETEPQRPDTGPR